MSLKTKNFSNVTVSLIAIVMGFLWLYINAYGLMDTQVNYIYGLLLGVLPVTGALFGYFNSNRWGGLSSSLGRSIFFLSSGLLTWGVGTLVFAYYNIALQVAVPYPSIADLFYILSWPLWAFAMVNLSAATGVKFALKDLSGKISLLVIPIFIALISYYLLIVIGRGGALDLTGGMVKVFFDLAYPIGDVVILTIATLIYGLSLKFLGGMYKIPIVIILLGFSFNYFADFFFSFTTTNETYFVGNWVDLIFTAAMFLLSTGVSLMDPDRATDKNHTS